MECWTSNRERLRRMNDWLQTIMVGRFDDENFMDGIEMLELAPEIVQGFLTMLVPLIQVREMRDVWARGGRHIVVAVNCCGGVM